MATTGSSGAPEEYTIVPVVEITNVSEQRISINVEPFLESQIYTRSGMQALDPGVSLTVEDNRLDLKAIENLANLKLLSWTRFNRRVAVTS